MVSGSTFHVPSPLPDEFLVPVGMMSETCNTDVLAPYLQLPPRGAPQCDLDSVYRSLTK